MLRECSGLLQASIITTPSSVTTKLHVVVRRVRREGINAVLDLVKPRAEILRARCATHKNAATAAAPSVPSVNFMGISFFKRTDISDPRLG